MRRAIFSMVLLMGFSGAVALAGSQVTLKIGGMDCEPCATAVKKRIEKLSGVEKVSVSFSEGKATVELKDGAKISKQDLKKAVEAAGYEFQGAEGI